VLFIGLFIGSCSKNIINKNNVAILPSKNPPGRLKTEEVPQFVCFGFDDNSYTGYTESGGDGGMLWAINLFKNKKNADGSLCKASFYFTTKYIDNTLEHLESDSLIKESWREAYLLGHEIGLHSHTHPHGAVVEWEKDPPVWKNVLKKADWYEEIEKNFQFLTKPYNLNKSSPSEWGPGITKSEIVGFRTPFLEFNNATFEALLEYQGVLYDCSIEEGFQDEQDGTNFYWPYQLDRGSPVSNATFRESFTGREVVGSYPGLWEMPAYCVIVPDDENCEKYGLQPGFRNELKKRVDYFNPEDGKITGFDWNLWTAFSMTKKEVEAVLKYTLDLRLKGNRAPFLIGMHSDMYNSKYKNNNDSDNQVVENYIQCQEAIENFINYALSKEEVRIVPIKSVLVWMNNPISLKEYP
jgi:peptidoglycan/xylan/chitin deacetylase (PgdA/CDA1 family)